MLPYRSAFPVLKPSAAAESAFEYAIRPNAVVRAVAARRCASTLSTFYGLFQTEKHVEGISNTVFRSGSDY
jgi:hypothetical protein